MDNSDDYFDDDSMVLDEEDLKSLQMAEDKFFASQQHKPPPSLPPLKKQKTTHSWTPPNDTHVEEANATEGISEVSVREDGSSSVRDGGPTRDGRSSGPVQGRVYDRPEASGPILKKETFRQHQPSPRGSSPLTSTGAVTQRPGNAMPLHTGMHRARTSTLVSRDNIRRETPQAAVIQPLPMGRQGEVTRSPDDRGDSYLHKELEDLRAQLAKVS